LISLRTTLPLLASALLLGCFKPSPPVVYHTLRGVSPRAAAASLGLAVEGLPVHLPEVLQRPQIVTTLGADSLELSPDHRWGNPLDRDVQRVLVEDLALLLGSDRVVAFPYGSRIEGPFRVEVNVQRCDGRPGGTLALRATWMITRPQGEVAVMVRRSAIDEPVPGLDAGALVAAHDRALAALAREIAEGLKAQP